MIKSSNYFFLIFIFTYFARIKFSEFRKEGILPIAVSFCMRLKKVVISLARDLICTIQKFNSFTGIKFPEFNSNEKLIP